MKDAVTGVWVCNALVVASLGADDIALDQRPELVTLRGRTVPRCDHFGAHGRHGTFRLTVTKAGYRPATETIVVEENDGCHFITQHAIIELHPERGPHRAP